MMKGRIISSAQPSPFAASAPSRLCVESNRRSFLANLGLGCAGLAMGSLLWQDGIARAAEAVLSAPPGQPHHRPRARNVIWIFLSGGVSHLETFDPKPALNKYAGKTYDETGLENPTKS